MKYYLKSSTLVFCNIFLRPSRIQVPLLKKNKCTSIEAIIITLHKILTRTNNIKQEINLHDMSDEESSIVGGE